MLGKKTGKYRYLELNGRLGYNATSIHSRCSLNHHNLNDDLGSMEYWFFPLEELTPSYQADHMKMNHPSPNVYTLISDNQDIDGKDAASFAMVVEKRWHPQFYVKMYKGDLSHRLKPPTKAFTSSEHMTFKKNKWYQICFSWDKTKGQYRIYVNGVLVSVESQFDKLEYFDKVGDLLYVGNPSLCISDINFYDKCFSQEDVDNLLHRGVPGTNLINIDILDPDIIKYLKKTFQGSDTKELEFKLNKEWQEKLTLSLQEQSHLNHFYVQGYTDAPKIVGDGLLIETPMVRQHKDTLEKQVYLWTKQVFEGDLYIEYEFKSLSPGGLSLLMTNASGMQREDFMEDYPLRTNGSMVTVYGEDVRNYHWEYYREMNDTRNDIASGGLTKNPFGLPLSYGCFDSLLERESWHKLQYVQRGGHIIGAIDGKVLVEAHDRTDTNSGGIYDYGHIALRCMVHTKLLVKNLKVYNRKLDYKVLKEEEISG